MVTTLQISFFELSLILTFTFLSHSLFFINLHFSASITSFPNQGMVHHFSLRISSLIKSGFQQNKRKTYFCANCKFTLQNIRDFCKNTKYEDQHIVTPKVWCYLVRVLPNMQSKTRTLRTYHHRIFSRML